MSELLPCPFCGGEAHISMSSDGYGVECWNRRCIDIRLEEIPTEAEAIAAWNSRAERTCEMYRYRNVLGFIDEWQCSECGADVSGIADDTPPNYCPKCGAKVVEQ